MRNAHVARWCSEAGFDGINMSGTLVKTRLQGFVLEPGSFVQCGLEIASVDDIAGMGAHPDNQAQHRVVRMGGRSAG